MASINAKHTVSELGITVTTIVTDDGDAYSPPNWCMTKTKLMAKAGEISGVKYKRNEIDKAIEDMDAIIKANINAETLLSDRP